MDPTQSFNTTTTNQRKERLESDSASLVSRGSIRVKRTESTGYLLVRKLARRGNAEGYRTNRSGNYWYNLSDCSLWLLLRVDAWKIKARHACPRWPCFVGYVCFIHTLSPLSRYPFHLSLPVMLSTLSLLFSFPFPLDVPVFSISFPSSFLVD